jgi:hypothetical protein
MKEIGLLDGVVLAQWKIEKIIPNGGMSGDGCFCLALHIRKPAIIFQLELHERSEHYGHVC